MTKRDAKIVYQPPEKCFTRVKVEETDHGYKVYRGNESRPFTFIPHNAVKQIEFRSERDGN
jgi:hypothetical protein